MCVHIYIYTHTRALCVYEKYMYCMCRGTRHEHVRMITVALVPNSNVHIVPIAKLPAISSLLGHLVFEARAQPSL